MADGIPDYLDYYEQELTYLRKLGAEFAQRYPKVASRLRLEPAQCEDPHVERLLEGFAFVAARLHRRLDEDFPEVSEALLEMLHPQLVRPVPSMAVVELELDPAQGILPGGFRVPRGSRLQSRPVQGVPCEFRTAYDTTLWPVRVTGAQWTAPDGSAGREAVGAIRLQLQAFEGARLDALAMDAWRLFLSADAGVTDTLLELLLNNCLQVTVRNPDRPGSAPALLGPGAFRPVGFGEDEALLPRPPRAFAGYGLLHELFAFPEKFRFVELAGLGGALRGVQAGARAEVTILFSAFEKAERRQAVELALSGDTFRPGCVPVVNLFERSAEPILLTERQVEHLVVADARRRLEVEVWAVDGVTLLADDRQGAQELPPLYSHRHDASPDGRTLFWQARRRRSGWRSDTATEVVLTFVDLAGTLRVPDHDTASVRITACNGDLPSRLPFGTDERGDFTLMSGGPVRRITALVRPTPAVPPRLGSPLLWRLISSLSLNHLSVTDGDAAALRELLRLHIPTDSESARRQVEGLVGVTGTPTFARVAAPHGIAFARGRRVELEFDEEQYRGGGMFLVASVLERFLPLYATMNSFTQVAVRSRQRRRPVVEWAPRAGWRNLL
jgi:type VI secretion system protein ImpG